MGAAVVSRVNAPPVLEFSKHVLDLVPLSVEHAVMGYLDFPVGFRWDTGFDLALNKGVTQPVGVISLVGQKSLCRGERRQKGRSTGVIADLACCQKQSAGPPLAVADRMKF